MACCTTGISLSFAQALLFATISTCSFRRSEELNIAASAGTQSSALPNFGASSAAIADDCKTPIKRATITVGPRIPSDPLVKSRSRRHDRPPLVRIPRRTARKQTIVGRHYKWRNLGKQESGGAEPCARSVRPQIMAVRRCLFRLPSPLDRLRLYGAKQWGDFPGGARGATDHGE